MTVVNIPRFERSNKIAVKFFSSNEGEKRLHVLHHIVFNDGRGRGSKPQCNLLLYENHYFTIRSLNPLFSVKQGKQIYVCQKCYSTFTKKRAFSRHQGFRGKKIKQNVYTPSAGTFLKFENFKNSVSNPFICYADLESIAVHYNVKKDDKTLLRKKHVAVSFGIMRVSENSKFTTKPYLYHGRSVIKRFLQY